MLEFLTLKPEAFGIDISDLSLKIAKLKKRGKFFDLVSFKEEKIEKGIIKEGEIKDEKKLSEIIKEAIKKVEGKKLDTMRVVASLPEEKSFCQVIKMPKLSEEDLKSAVVFEAEKYIPLPIEDVYLDCQVVPPISNLQKNLDVLISATPKKIVDSYLSSLKLAGLQPIAFEIESMAIARALIKDEFSPAPVLIIDLGATRTSFIIFYGRAIRFTCSIPISSIGFTEIISKSLKVSLKEAEELKRKYGLEEKVKLKVKDKETIKLKVRGRIFEALIPPLVDLVDQIRRYLDFYESRTGKKIKKILLCGGGANLKGLVELLAIELKLPVELGNPWLNILEKPEKGSEKLFFEKSLAFTTALGLALRGIK
jgi:type IV pilus assembly protein PilM